jgi:hypothetical protein
VNAVASAVERVAVLFRPTGKLAAAGPGAKLKISDSDRKKIRDAKERLIKNSLRLSRA